MIIFLAAILLIFATYAIYERWPTHNWKEYRSLVGIWPRIRNEKIESISFCNVINSTAGYIENESFLTEAIETFLFRKINEDIVRSWDKRIEIPKESIQECTKIIDRIMKNKKHCWIQGGNRIWLGRMLIVTDKGKYIVHVETDISEVASAEVYGQEWRSYELGKFIAKHCFPNIEYKYSFPQKEQVVAVLVYPPKFSPPLAIMGDLKKAEKLLFEKEFPESNGIHGIAGLYKFTRLRTFGIETKEKDGKFITVNEIKPKKVFGQEWLEKLIDAYEIAIKEAEAKEKYYPGLDYFNARIVFMTQDKDYWKEIWIGKDIICDDYIESKQLKDYFDEIGLTPMLFDSESNHCQKRPK